MKKDEAVDSIIYDLEKSPNKSTKVNSKVLILSTPRSGSSLFCDIINQNFSGYVAEWFNPRYILSHNRIINKKTDSEININSYLKYITPKVISDEGVFIANVHIEDASQLLKNGFNILELNFDHICYIKRKDKVAQAVSLLKAKLTNSWTHETKENTYNNQDFNLPNTAYFLTEILKSEHVYQQQLSNFTNCEYIYEQFTSDNSQSYKDFFNRVDLPEPTNFKPKMKVQGNIKNNVLIEEFKSLLK